MVFFIRDIKQKKLFTWRVTVYLTSWLFDFKGEIWFMQVKAKSIESVKHFEQKQWRFDVNRMKNKEDMKLWISVIVIK